MTTHDKAKIIAAANECHHLYSEWNIDIERFYAIAFEAGRQAEREEWQAGAASRDAEIAELVAALELLSKYIAYNGDDWVQRTALEALAKVRKP